MTARKGKLTGQGLNFGGRRARELKARLKAIKHEIQRNGRTSLMDAARQATGDEDALD